MQRLQQKKHYEDGFSLVELLVVIVILGTLAAIVVYATGGIVDKGQNSATGTDAINLQVAEEAYFARAMPAGAYTDESTLVLAQHLRSVSIDNYLCIENSPNANADYFVLAAPLPTDGHSAAAACNAAAQVAPNAKPAGSTWIGSEGGQNGVA
jgi:prepilin-type N-terminal cleavage/methylation domain-containing protein